MGTQLSRLLGVDCSKVQAAESPGSIHHTRMEQIVEVDNSTDRSSTTENTKATRCSKSGNGHEGQIIEESSVTNVVATPSISRKRSYTEICPKLQKYARTGHLKPEGSGDDEHENHCANCANSSTDSLVHRGHNGDSVHHVNDLPYALLLQVFHKLSMADLLNRASLVSKYWYDLAHDPVLWRVIKLARYIKLGDEELIRVTRYSDNVIYLDLTDTRVISMAGLESALKQCKHLQELKLTRCQQFTKEAFMLIGEHCHHLHKIYLECCYGMTDSALEKLGGSCSKLEQIRLNQCSRISDEGISVLASGSPQLKYISLDQCSKVTDVSVEMLVKHCPLLESVSFMSCNLTDVALDHLSKLKHLKVLELSNVKGLSNAGVIKIIHHCKYLESINLSLCHNMNDKCVEAIAHHSKHIKNIYMVSCNVTNHALVTLGDYSKTVQSLDVGWCDSITDEGVTKISETCPSLTYLGLMRCDNVSVATMEKLVNKYPHITYSTMWLDCMRLLQRAKKEGHNVPHIDLHTAAHQAAAGGGDG